MHKIKYVYFKNITRKNLLLLFNKVTLIATQNKIKYLSYTQI